MRLSTSIPSNLVNPPTSQQRAFDITPYLIHATALLTRSTYAELIKTEAGKLGLATDPHIIEALLNQSPILAGASGGKDSDCLVILIDKLLNAIHYTGERVVIHADLGEIEHIESLDQVKRLANFVGWKLEIVKRAKGGLLDRYAQRWRDNCTRWANLECVNLISPFPQATTPFCRSETKVAPITQAAVKLFPGKMLLSAIGIRAEESAKRAKKPISLPNDKLSRADGTTGRDWFPLLNTTIETVWLTHRNANFSRHVQYDRGNERVSCSFCFLASLNDWQRGAEVPTNHGSYIKLSDLEIRSGFSYRQQNWLADVRPDILPDRLREQIPFAKQKAHDRKLIEGRTPKELLFTNHGGKRGWPASQPSLEQCQLLAEVRLELTKLMGHEIEAITGLEINYTTAQQIYDRYQELLKEKSLRLATALKKSKPNTTPQGHNVSQELEPMPPVLLNHHAHQSLLF